MVQFSAERVPASEIKYVVPFEVNSKSVGADYFAESAREEDGSFKRNLPGIGIVETMEGMRGPNCDPDKIDPLIRRFIEHTSRFTLSIVPVWKNRIKPLFWLFKRTIAQPMGQANLPFNTEEAQRGSQPILMPLISNAMTSSTYGAGCAPFRRRERLSM